MEDKKDFFRVDVMGIPYRLKKTEDEEYLRKVAGKVDSVMREISGKYPVVSSDRVAVLAAMRICDECWKEISGKDDMEKAAQSEIDDLSESLRFALK